MKDWNNLIADVDKIMNKNYTPGRNGRKIQHIVLHHNAGTLTVEGCWNNWQTREASAHYQVELGGRIGQLVNDWDTAWHAANEYENSISIGIEHANNILAPVWSISDATLDNGAHLVAALCKYYGLGAPVYGRNVWFHSDFYGTACPGAIAGRQKNAYFARANYWYNVMMGKPVDSSQTGTATKPSSPATPQVWPGFPLNTSEYFGNIDGPNESHGGFYEWERPFIKRIQEFLVDKGYAGKVNKADWCDGIFEQPTVDAVAAWQRDNMPETEYYGQVWWDDWDAMRRIS